MRLSLLKAAHANIVGAAYGKCGGCAYGYETEVAMSKMLRKKLITAEFLVTSSLLLAPGLALTGYGQNTPQNAPQSSPPTAAPSDTPPAASTPPGTATDPTMPGVK